MFQKLKIQIVNALAALSLKKVAVIELVFTTKLYMLVSSLFQAVNAETIQEVCTKYIYEKSPAIAAVGKLGSFYIMQ